MVMFLEFPPKVSWMDGNGGKVIAVLRYCTGHGPSAPTRLLAVITDTIVLFDTAVTALLLL